MFIWKFKKDFWYAILYDALKIDWLACFTLRFGEKNI